MPKGVHGGMTPRDRSVAAPAGDATHPGYNQARTPSRIRTLRDVRLEKNVTIRQLERLSGVSRATISQIERGRMIASRTEAARIAEALGLEPGSLRTRTTLVLEEATSA